MARFGQMFKQRIGETAERFRMRSGQQLEPEPQAEGESVRSYTRRSTGIDIGLEPSAPTDFAQAFRFKIGKPFDDAAIEGMTGARAWGVQQPAGAPEAQASRDFMDRNPTLTMGGVSDMPDDAPLFAGVEDQPPDGAAGQIPQASSIRAIAEQRLKSAEYGEAATWNPKGEGAWRTKAGLGFINRYGSGSSSFARPAQRLASNPSRGYPFD